ncbi:DUF349 domain-containing protein [Rhabdochromatium marinum]|uniref:DUF349 domain-containing protein n=1 Tax=Rhabdochromatium marinum TaxID=48729 RepID=UPI001905B192|nr:DUF349 domain-containing protein [Rhabdochromatium marinum]MBK1649266.1 hypothetical protein [Rhabdochromatium marinum]
MIFKRLFRKAPPPPPPTPEELAEAALNGTDTAQRRQACRVIDDLSVLRQVAERSPDIGTRELAAARYRHLLCALESEAAQLPQALTEIAEFFNSEQLGAVALEARAPELRRAAIERLPTDAPLLARCAMEDALPSLRHQAVERIASRELLEQVVRQIGKRDTKVYRLAREKLRALAQQTERPQLIRQRCAELCTQLERLGRFNNWIQDRARLKLLDQQWNDIQAEVAPEDRDTYPNLRAAFIAGFEQYTRANFQTNTQHTDADTAERPDLSKSDPSEPDPSKPTGRETQTDSTCQTKSSEQTQETAAQRDAQRTQLLTEVKALLASSGSIDRHSARQLQQQLEPLLTPPPETPDALDREATAQLESLERRLNKQRRHAERKLAAAPEQLQSLTTHLDAGELRKAEPLYQKLSATLDQARAAGLPGADIKTIDKALKAHQSSLRELQRWRRWSADQGRESLCHDAECLAANTTDALDTLAARLNNLRRDWRKIDQSGTPASESYWQRFKQATDQVASRCEPYFQARAERQRASREARRTLCEQLEHFLAAVDWDKVDWKAMVRAEREMRQAWNALEPLEAHARGGLEGRFRRSLAQIDKALKEERALNRAHKRDLVERMRALADESDLERAIHEAKALQQQWRTTVSGRQQEENSLWQKFRAASDAVFARRHQERASRHQEFHHNQEQREALCQQAEALAQRPLDEATPGTTSETTSASQLRADWEQLAQQWHDSHKLPVPRQAKKSLEQRWQRAEQRLEQQLRTLQEQADWRELTALKQQADFLSAQAITLLSDDDTPAPEREALLAQWSALGGSSTPASTLHQGFDQLLAALDDSSARAQLAERCEAGRQQREELCLRLEILAHLDSPPAQMERRMELQVERLRDKLGDGDSGALIQSKPLLEQWHLSAPAAADADLHARFECIEAALKPAA